MTVSFRPEGENTKRPLWGVWTGAAILFVLLLAVAGVLLGNRAVHESVLTPFWQPTITLTATITWTPSATYTPSVTPTPTITPTATPPVIGADFTPELVELARMEGLDTINGVWGNRYNTGNKYGVSTFSPDGNFIATYTAGKVLVLDIRTGKIVQQWEFGSEAMMFSSDGNFLVVNNQYSVPYRADHQRKIQILRIADGSVEWEMPLDAYDAYFSPDGQYIAFAGAAIEILDLHEREIVFTIPNNIGVILDVTFSPDNSLIAVTAGEGIIHILNRDDGSTLVALNLHSPRVRDVVFSPDGSVLTAISSAGKVYTWQSRDWQLLPDIPIYTTCYLARYTPDGSMLAITAVDVNEIYFIDTTTRKLIHTFQQSEGIYYINFSNDGKELAISSSEGLLRVWNLDYEPYDGSSDWTITERLVREFPGGHTASVISVAFSPDGSLLASASADHTVKIWRTEDWVTKYTLMGHENPVEIVAFSPDGALLASGADDKTVRIWDTQSGAEVKVLEGHEEPIFALSFSPDGNLLASGSADRTVKIWQVSDWSLATTLEDHGDWVWSVSFSPDGKLLASASGDSYVRLWQVSDWQMLGKFGEGGAYAGAVAFSPDQTIIGRGGWDGQVRLYDVETTELLRTLTDPEMQKEDWWEHTSRIWSIAFSPDGSLVVAASLDQNVRIWRVSDGELLQVLEMDADVYSVAVSRNGWWMAAASGVDVTIWGLPRWEQIPNANATLQPTPTP